MKQAIPHKHLKTGLSQVPCRIKDIYAAWTLTFKQPNRSDNAPINVNPLRGGGGGSGVCRVFDHQLHPHPGDFD